MSSISDCLYCDDYRIQKLLLAIKSFKFISSFVCRLGDKSYYLVISSTYLSTLNTACGRLLQALCRFGPGMTMQLCASSITQSGSMHLDMHAIMRLTCILVKVFQYNFVLVKPCSPDLCIKIIASFHTDDWELEDF